MSADAGGPTPPTTSGLDRPPLAELLLDQRRRWLRADYVRVEVYLEQHPSLWADSESLLDLIYNEVTLRERVGEPGRPEEYLERFPQIAPQVRLRFEVDRVVQDERAPSSTASGTGGLAAPPGDGPSVSATGFPVARCL